MSERFDDAIVGQPGDASYARAAAVFNLAAPVRPAAAVTVTTLDELRAALRHAERHHLPVRVHTTGHGAAAARPMHGALLIRTEFAEPVTVDAERGVARVPAGARWGEVVAASAPFGLAAPHGSSPSVGVIGFVLRGGLSFYGRRTGLAVNSVRSVDLMTADGLVHHLDTANEAELFWAVRGGGGGFGVVTAVEIELLPAARVITGAIYWPARDADRLLRLWRDWTVDAPLDVTTSARVMNLPPSPNVPPAFRRPLFVIDGVVRCATDASLALGREHAAQLLDPLRAAAVPVLDTWQLATPDAVPGIHLDPTDPVPFIGDHMLLRELDDEAISAWLSVVGEGSRSPLIVASLRQLGGAFARPSPTGGVLSHLSGRFSYAGSGSPLSGASAEQLRAYCGAVRRRISQWDSGRTVPSFVESVDRPHRHLKPAQVDYLDRIRHTVDPGGVFAGDAAPGTTARPVTIHREQP